MTIHAFTDSGAAYDATQSSDDVRKGDVLLIASERVVGLADTWPFAVTVAAGALHTIRGSAPLTDFAPLTSAHFAAAVALARANAWPVCPVAASFADALPVTSSAAE